MGVYKLDNLIEAQTALTQNNNIINASIAGFLFYHINADHFADHFWFYHITLIRYLLTNLVNFTH